MRLTARFVSIAVGLAVVLVAAVGMGGLLGLNPFGSKTVDRSQPVLLKSIQDLSQFHAAVGNFEVVLDYENDVKLLPGFIAGERSLFVAAGTVNAYVDFSGLAKGDLVLSDDGKSVKITLPDAELDKPNLDQDRTYLVAQERGVLNRVNDALSTQDQQALYKLAEKKLVAAAGDSALAKQADENTRTMLVGLFKSLDITATFADDAP